MKISLKNKFWVKLLSGLVVAAAVIIPSISLVSCSDNTTNSDNNGNGVSDSNGDGSNSGNNSGDNNNSGSEDSLRPNPVLPLPDTSNVRTFNEAKIFTKKYLETNYNMDLFNRDAKYGMYKHVLEVKETYEKKGFEVVDYVSEFNAYEENNKIFFNGEYRIYLTGGAKWIRTQNNMSVQNARIEPIFVLRNNVVHVELAVSYNIFVPSAQKYDSLEALKANNPDWQDKIIVNTINANSNNLGGSSSRENKWLIAENKSGGDYILKPNASDDSVSFLNNWQTIKLLSLPISFSNISDINDNLKPE